MHKRVRRDMSICDRLTRFGLFPQFEAAVVAQDTIAVVEVLLKARLSLVDADLAAQAMLPPHRERASTRFQ